ncbi:hypothetical protein FEE95_12800 [Maribacter algarum]|uniref:DUF4064 domain-containing protein n=1 Tax=Maribacter algarum (ex Zhang et al. 2020) TaxID=2578118 RepID=A0A5S3PRI4_9FLAO|nr:hypothetical protein [Maribacter algarum]TMM57357.1 hypothetical protein FEE95_12800 [Maribacter algarum]
MTDVKGISKTSKLFCIIGSSFLLIMGLFHGSGFFYVSETIEKSNAEGFLKDIVPALFAHPSIHLIGLAAFGILALFLKQDLRKVTWLLAVLIALDAALGFYLGGMIPGILLLLAAICFVVSGLRDKSQILI